MTATAIRGKDWIFNAFWAACGEKNAPVCSVSIPITVLFHEGTPFKALGNDHASRSVRRIDLHNVPLERTATERGFRGESFRTIRAMRQLLLEYAAVNGYEQFQSETSQEIILCNAFYTDGEIEALDLRTLDILLRNETWRRQVMFIQGFVPAKSLQTGNYSHAPKVRSLLDDLGTATADNFTRAIAKYAERAYIVSSEQLIGRDLGKPMGLKVMNMDCRFALDPHDNVIFLYSDYTAVEIDNGQREIEDYLTQEKKGREISAAQAINREVYNLLSHAHNRGLSIDDSFAHFDVAGNGFIDVDLLIDGLARLGIGVTYPVGESLMQMIGGIGSTFITKTEFAKFIQAPADEIAFNRNAPGTAKSPTRKDGGSPLRQSHATVRSSGTKEKKTKQKRKAKKLDQLLPPAKPDDTLAASRDFMNIEASQLHEWEDLGENEFEEASKHEAEVKELPLPVETYTTIGAHIRAGAEMNRTLPTWARTRSKTTLRELEKAQGRRQTQQQNIRTPMIKSESLHSVTAPIEVDSLSQLPRPQSMKSPRDSKRSKSHQSSPFASPKKSSPSRAAAPKVQPLSLAGISQDFKSAEFVQQPTDQLLHVDHGVIMTYRVLNGKGHTHDANRTHEKVDALRYRSYLEERKKRMGKAKEHGALRSQHATAGVQESKEAHAGMKSPHSHFVEADSDIVNEEVSAEEADMERRRRLSFTLVIIPDLFMTLDTLQLCFEPLLMKYPFAQLVLVGLPGLPSTTWPTNWVLSPDLHARSIAKLLQHLTTGGEIENSDAPLFYIGIGSSSPCLARFITLFCDQLPVVHQRSRAMIMVNGLLRHNKKFKQVCKDLRQAMITADSYEVNELIPSIHFYSDYLTLNGREQCLDKFWSSRRTLRMNNTVGGADGDQAGLGYMGVLELLKGIIISPDDFDGATMLLGELPLVVVQSTEDMFVDPKNAALFRPEQLPPGRTLVAEVCDALDDSAVHVSWLRAGHEVLQERSPFILGLISQLAQLSGIKPAITNDTEKNDDDSGDVFDVLHPDDQSQGSSQGRSIGTNKGGGSLAGDSLASDLALQLDFDGDAERHEKECEEDERGLMAAEETEMRRILQLREQLKNDADAARLLEEERVLQAKRRADEKLKRAQQAIERKKRQMQRSRQNNLEILYLREQEELDRKNEARETTKMKKEDARSKHAADYVIECKIAELSKEIAKARAEELSKYRREEAIKAVEDKMAFERSERLAERRKKAADIVKSIEAEELVLSGEKEGGYDLPEDMAIVQKVIDSSNRLMRDLLECRQKTVEAIKRQHMIQEKTELFRKQVSTVENDERRLRRAIRLIQLNPTIVGDEMNAESQLNELKLSLSQKQETLVELQAISTQREAQLHAANRSVQLLKVAGKERQELMTDRVDELHVMERDLAKRLTEMKVEKERLIVKRDRLRVEVMSHQRRSDQVSKELIRVRQHKGKLIDTDVWVAGVMQRCVTKELKQHLKNEIAIANGLRDNANTELHRVREQVFNNTEIIYKLKRDMGKISGVTKALFKTFSKFNAVPVASILQNIANLQERAEKIEVRRQRESNIELMFAVAGSNSIVDKVRLKESEIRTKDERQFVGLDMVLHPEAYLHLSVVEAEQMQFDEDYHCTLSKTDLERLLKLPEQINLALPFLHTEEEVNAHRLINTFYRGKDESFFRNKDYYSTNVHPGAAAVAAARRENDGNLDDDNNSLDEMSFMMGPEQVKRKDMSKAEVVHDILVRESLRDRLRAAADDEDLTEEERQWKILDKILSPFVFDAEELEPERMKVMTARSTATISTMQSATTNGSGPSLSQSPSKPSAGTAAVANSTAESSQQNGSSISKRSVQETLSTSMAKTKTLDADGNIVMKKVPNRSTQPHSDGKVYQELRDLQEKGADVFQKEWRCPYTRSQLLAIRRTPLDRLRSPDAILVRNLMNKYYVDDTESILGHSTLLTVEKMVAMVSKAVRVTDDIAKKEFAALAEARIAEEDIYRKSIDSAEIPHSGASITTSIPTTNISEKFDGTIDKLKNFEDDAGSVMTRIWGSWNEVHPACAGAESQTHPFRLSTFDPSRDHPGSFAIKHEEIIDEEDLSDDESMDFSQSAPGNTEFDLQLRGVNVLTSLPGDNVSGAVPPSKRKNGGTVALQRNDPHSQYFIVDNIPQLAQCDPAKLRGKIVLLMNDESLNLMNEKNATLQARQSRSHYFNLPAKESIRALDITVTVVFKGEFGGKGYKLGRLAAGLFRLPDESRSHGQSNDAEEKAPGLPTPVGYGPYHLQSPNLPDQMGRVVLVHKPRNRPLKPGSYQIVIGVASNTKYSVEVTCRYAQTALPMVDEAITNARKMQGRLPAVLAEIDSVDESIRLAERKLLVCDKMIQEAEMETERCQKGMRVLKAQLERDDEDMMMMEDERRDVQRELGIFEVEYTQWASTFSTRSREREDVKDGINMMYKFKRDKVKEKEDIKLGLENSRRDLPPCIAVLRNTTEAVNVAASLNTILHNISEEANAAISTGDFGGIQVSTPADDVRRQMKQGGFKSLSLEEQRWSVLDQAMNPQKYEWLRELEEKEDEERLAAGKSVKKRKLPPELEDFKLSKVEIEYILETPFSMLNRREMIVRKLITKYHDDKEYLKKSIQALAYSFDPHLAERTRAKNPAMYTQEEADWSLIDRKLHPEIWKFYVNRSDNPNDRHNADSRLESVLQHREKRKQQKAELAAKRKQEKAAKAAAEEEERRLAEEKKRKEKRFLNAASAFAAGIGFGRTTSIMSPTGSEKNNKSVASPGGSEKTSKSFISNILPARSPKNESTSPNSPKSPKKSARSVEGNEGVGDFDRDALRNMIGEDQLSGAEGNVRNRSKKLGKSKLGGSCFSTGSCPFSREEILRIWRTPRNHLQTEEERAVFKLLQKYNGSYTSYMDAANQAKRRQKNFVKEGHHIQWDKLGKLVSKDVDFRARQLLREIDRATHTKNEWIHSDVLHANDQRFPTRVLRMHLEEALDTLLSEQIRDRERAQKIRIDSSDSEEEYDVDGNLKPIDLDEEDEVSLGESFGAAGEDADILNKVRKRAQKREKRKRKLKKLSEEKEVQKAKKVLANKKTGLALAEALLQNELGVNGCLACRTRKCKWTPSIDVEVCQNRCHELDQEIERVRLDRDAQVFESDICLSAQLGGNRIFKRFDLMDELMFEKRELEQRLDLNNVDKELHDAYATRKEYFESHHLHGYSILLWTNNARKALEDRQSRLCALSVSKEIVDDILDWMLEGWYFGERESRFNVLGYVPSVKKDGKIRPGQDQISSVVNVVSKMKKRAENRRNNILTAESTQGLMVEKAWAIEEGSQQSLKKLKVARDGNEHEHMLNETEVTLKFGIFMITLMYFRAMTFLRREQKSWAGEGEEIGVADKNKPEKVMTDERMRMIDEENREKARRKKIDIVLARCRIGEARRAEREAQERREALMRLQAIVRRQRLELECITTLQRVYRGHLGRKAARRWALKRAELGAMNSLLNASAIAIQRVYRGFMAREVAVQKRKEMAHFIALTRVQETAQDEEIYWQTHPWSRFKKNQREWMDAKLEKYRQQQMLGGSRLTAAEQAELESKSLSQIEREIAGMDEEDEDDDYAEDGDDESYIEDDDFRTEASASRRSAGVSGRTNESASERDSRYDSSRYGSARSDATED